MKYARIQDGRIFEFFNTEDGVDIKFYFGDYGVWVPVNAKLKPQPEQNWSAHQDEGGTWHFTVPEIPAPTEVESRWQRYALLRATDWAVTRHRDQQSSGGATALSEEDYQGLLRYRQELRDVTQQSGFPAEVLWPAPPSSMAAMLTQDQLRELPAEV